MTTRARLLAPLATVFAAALLLSGCSASGAYDSPDWGGAGADGGGAGAPVAEDGYTGGDTGNVDVDGGADRALVITGSMTITTDDPIAAAEDATAVVTAAGGRVDARTQFAPRGGDAGSAYLVLRIPANALERVREQLGELGRVDETRTEAVDMGRQLTDIQARITTLRTSIERYTGWLAEAKTTKDLIELEQAISSRQAELESLEAQQRELSDAVAMSTIELNLRSEALAPAPEPVDFWSALGIGWSAFVGFWAAVLVGIGVGLPWLVLLGLGAFLTVVIVRRRRRSARGAVDTANPPSQTDTEDAA